MAKKRIGTLSITRESGYINSSAIWATMWHTEDEHSCVTVFFTQTNDPRTKAWFRSLMDIIKTGTWRIILKGTYKYGYYYKTVGTTLTEKAEQMFNEMNGWEFESADGDTYSVEITKDFDTFNNEMFAKML